MVIVPLRAIPSQVVNVTLGGQPCQIALYQLATGLYCNLYVRNVIVIGGVICHNVNRIVRDLYLGFIGDLIFVDSQGKSDPEYSGLGGRYELAYLTAAEAADK
jgi:hypothetical protein